MVIATQNPIEMEGTHGLPEAQRDRFQFKLTVDIPAEEPELALMDRFDGTPDLGPTDISQVVTEDEIVEAREVVTDVYVDAAVKSYIRDLVAATRDNPALTYGASPRATLTYMRTAKARAAIRGRDYVLGDDVKALANPVLAHRIALSTDAELSDQTTHEIITDILDSVSTPAGTSEADVARPPLSSDGGTPATDHDTESHDS